MTLSNLTEEEKYLLLRFSYVDLPEDYMIDPKNPANFGKLLDEMMLISSDYEENKDFKAIFDYVNGTKGSNLANIQLTSYQNNNPTWNDVFHGKLDSGFVGYALKDDEGNATSLFRGSESLGSMLHIMTDWKSNVDAGIGQEIQQQREAALFFKENILGAEGDTFVMGHSKGGNLANYVLVKFFDQDEKLKSYVVNGAPINWWILSKEEQEVLKSERNTFIVHADDGVSQLGHVPYVAKTIQTKNKMGKLALLSAVLAYGVLAIDAHSLDAVEFDENGNFIGATDGASSGRMAGNFIFSGIMLPLSFDAIRDKAMASLRQGVFQILTAIATTAVEMKQKLDQKLLQIKIECIRYIFTFMKVSQKLKQDLNQFFDRFIDKAKSFAALLWGTLTGGHGFAVEPILKVDLSRLAYYSSRLQALKRRTQHVNSMIDSLYREADLLDLGHVLKADMLTTFHFRINDNIQYLNRTMELLEKGEAALLRKAEAIR
ncbi:Mbeg1-like protein [Neobacillus sp. NPDC058068]|uniref:Mbeg1-like protein n=1 Tax=Neobacillus sp. NPDC058068 TaxID=3346325 RepID=UPI0036DF3AED